MRFFLAICLCFLIAFEANAHAVFVDAWVEGDTMCAEGSFAGKAKAKNSTVTVNNDAGETLHEGRTDNAGKVCFPLPQKAAKLTFVLNAGQGHRAEAVLYEDDFPETAAPAPSAAAPAPAKAEPVSPAATIATPAPSAVTSLDETVREAVRQEMQKQLGPIRQSLASLQNREPGMLEIFGGIGWIVGLAGAAALASTRRRQK